MDKREFLKTTGAFVAASVLPSFNADAQAPPYRTNWAGNLLYSTNNLQTPATVDELQHIVRSSSSLRALGSRHSFNAIADSAVEQVSLAHFSEMILDEKTRTVTVGGGVTYSQLAPWLTDRGYALQNLASLPGITIAGAVSTATHGSGLHNGNLATPVAAIEFVAADGNLVRLSRDKDKDEFAGAVVALGALGIVRRITLDIEPGYQVAQSVYLDLNFDQLARNFDAIFGAGYSVSLFTDWQNHRATEVWVKKRLAGPADSAPWPEHLFGAALAKEKLHPVLDQAPNTCTDQLGIPGPWYDRLPHFRIGQTPSTGAELQTEYLVPYEHGYQAILAVEKLRDQITPHLFVTELRTIAADSLWMSTAYERQSLAIHFTWKPEWPAVQFILPQIEAALAPFDPRPHWGKLFTLPPAQLQSRYKQLASFKALISRYDPQGKFRNPFLAANLYTA